MRAGQSLPPLLWPLTLVVCLGFGGLALALGMDASWDLRNYHFYNGWAFLHGVVGRDLLVSQIPSFFNPTLDAAYVFLAEHLPARAVAFVLGTVHGLNFPLLFAIGWRVLEVRNPNRRILAAGALALAGVLGAAGLSLVGTVFYDNVVSIGILASVLIVVSYWDEIGDGDLPLSALVALLAGLPAGLAFGLKQPSVLFCVGLTFAFLFTNLPLFRRLWAAFWLGIGVIGGLVLGGGHWMATLWHAYGNPLFPFFNHIFLSPWGLPAPYRDPGFLQGSLWDMVTFGFRFPFHPHLAGEVDFRDYRVLAVIVLVPLAALASLTKRDRDPGVITVAGPTGWLMAMALIAYAVWVVLFCIYRYLVPLEMLTPLLVVAAVGCLPLPRVARRGLASGIIVFLAVTTLPGNWLRVPFTAHTVEADVPAVADPAHTLVLVSGHEPLSFLIPLFPHDMQRFLRIDSTFSLPDDPDTPFRRIFRDAIANHGDGQIRSLHITTEEHDVVRKLAEYGLELDKGDCPSFTAPIGAAPYAFCLTRPIGSAAPPPPDGGSGNSAGSPEAR